LFKPLKVNEFKEEFPNLWHNVLLLIAKELEKANLRTILKRAENCDYEYFIKLVYHSPETMQEKFFQEKRNTLVNKIRESRGKRIKAATYLKQLTNAEIGKYPFVGRKEQLQAEPAVLTEQFIKTVHEIQKLSSEIDCNHKDKIKLFSRESEFLQEVKQLKLNDPYFQNQNNEEQIIVDAEKAFIVEICSAKADKEELELAITILSERYHVETTTLKKKILPGIYKKVKKLYPNLPSQQSEIDKLVNTGLHRHRRSNLL
jgi:hypothetical protein